MKTLIVSDSPDMRCRISKFACAVAVVLGLNALCCTTAFSQSARPGSAVSLNGTVGTYIQVPNGVWFTNDFTVEGWVYVRSYNNWSRFFDFGNGEYFQDVYVALSEGATGVPKMGIFNTGNVTLLTASQQIALYQWTHLAVTFSNTLATMYMNGNVVGTQTFQVPTNVLRTNCFIGRSVFAGDAHANASYDDVRIWNVARSQGQIQAFMRHSLSGGESNLLANWRMDEGSGTNLVDATGNGQNATMMGGSVWTNSASPVAASGVWALNFTNNPGQTALIAHSPALNAYPLTVMCWFMAPPGSTRGGLVCKYNSASYNGYNLWMAGGRLSAWYFGNNNSNVYNAGIMDGGPVNDGRWHHAAMVVDATGGKLFLDGTLRSSIPWTGMPMAPTTTVPLSLGVYQGDSFWSGQLDEVSVWNVGLSSNQITSAMNKPLAGTENGLLGYWRLDEGSGTNLVDATGHGYNSTNNNATWVPSGAGVYIPDPGYALNMNGINQYAQASNSPWFTNDFTVEGLVYVRSYKNWSRLIDFANGPGTNNVFLALSAGTTGNPCFGVYTNNNGVPNILSPVQLPLNQWVHLAATLSNTTGRIYINGNLVVSGTLNRPVNVVRTNNYIGRSAWSGDAYADAMFEELRIWNVARTQTQLLQNMNTSLGGNETGLVGYWRFDEGSGTNVLDSAGTGRMVTFPGTNNPTWVRSAAPYFNTGMPNVTTLPATAVAGVSATFNGRVNPGGEPTGVWFEYGNTTNYGNFTAMTSLAVSNALVTVTNAMTGLSPLTLYHYRVAAANSLGTNFGLDQTFTTLTASNANLSALTISAGTMVPAFASSNVLYSVNITNGTTSSSTVQVRPTKVDPDATLQLAFNGGAFTSIISGQLSAPLPLDVGTNTIDIQVSAPDLITVKTYTLSVVRRLALPIVTTQPASGVSSNVATLNATVNPSASPTYAWFEWGTTTNYGNVTLGQSVGSGGVANPSELLSGLTGGTTYHYRVVATNAAGLVNGLNQTFRTIGTFFLTNYNDSGFGTLRALVANTISGDTILITNASTIGLQSYNNPITITNNISIIGPAGTQASISGNNITRVFNINPGATVTMINLRILNGRGFNGGPGSAGSPGFNGYTYYCGSPATNICYVCGSWGGTGGAGQDGQSGGGIYNQGTLKMTGCVINGNSGGNGGNGGNGGPAGYNPGGPCSPTQMGVGGNGGYGGYGGGIWSVGTLIMNNCTVYGNAGGQYGYGGYGSTYGQNGYAGVGGGIACSGITSLTNCTIAQNNSGNNGGGGIYNYGGTLTLVACTVTANTCTYGGSGIFRSSGALNMRNTIVADNGSVTDLSGSFASGGRNLISRADATGGMNSGLGDLWGTMASPRYAYLNYLGNYGSPLPTCPPSSSSYSVIDMGDNSLMNAPFNLVTDQNGRYRRYGNNVDIGAAEYTGSWFIQYVGASYVGSTNASVYAYLDSSGVPSAVYVQYGINFNYLTNITTVSNLVAGAVGPRNLGLTMTGLIPGTTYYYRAVMTNLVDFAWTSTSTPNFTTLSSNATLNGLALSSGTLSPAFTSSNLSYTATAAPEVSSVTATATKSGTYYLMRTRVNGGNYSYVSSGNPSGPLPLKVGTNLVDVEVTAQDGVTKATYTTALEWYPPIPAPTLTDAAMNENGTFGFSFTSLPGAPFTVWANDDLATTNWFSLGPVADNPPGTFQFTDATATNSMQRFYQLRSP